MMKTNKTLAAVLLASCAFSLTAFAQVRVPEGDAARRIAKVDLDADFNYDGQIDNWDPTDNGAVQVTPPGLYIGAGEMAKMIIRIKPYRIDSRGEAVISLEVTGINRADESGLFGSFEEEVANTGHIRVWKDSARSVLLLDSADPELRRMEWTIETGSVPGYVFVEGVRPSVMEGDLAIRLKCESRRKVFKSFDETYDHNIVTVVPRGKAKVTDSAVWVMTGDGMKK